MKTFTLTLSLFFLLGSISPMSGQKLKKVKTGSRESGVQEIFSIIKKSEIRQGKYQMLYNTAIIVDGHYDKGNRTGHWKYNDYMGIVNFNGNFKNDLKDSVWTYYHGETLQARMYYSQGVLDSAFSYYPDGNLLWEKHEDINGSGDIFKYFQNGVVQEHRPLKNNKIDGTAILQFENGKLYRKIEFHLGKPLNLLLTQNQNGNPIFGGTLKNGDGTFIDYGWPDGSDSTLHPSMVATYEKGILNGSFVKYPVGGLPGQKGNYLDGDKVGMWVDFNAGTVLDSTFYDVGDTLSVDSTEFSSDLVMLMSLSTKYTIVEVMPEFPGGEEAFMSFIMRNIRYPSAAKNQGKQGTVYVTFTVDETGYISQPEILRSRGESLDNEAIRVVNAMPRWNPGFQNGIPVRVRYNLPMRFTLR